METREYQTTDKSSWGFGPWQDEPDKRQWRDETTGLACLIVRNPKWGNLCGYVGVPPSHPGHAKAYNFYRDDEAPHSAVENAINNLRVHGGLTFADGCSHGSDESRGVCHVPSFGEPDDVWWFGFDCAHAWDLLPGIEPRYRDPLDAANVYRDVDCVTSECASLAYQLSVIDALNDVYQAAVIAITTDAGDEV